MTLPTWTSPFAEIAATWQISAVVVIVFVLVARNFDNTVNRSLGTSMEVHGVASHSNDLDTLSLNGAGENGGCHRAISGHLFCVQMLLNASLSAPLVILGPPYDSSVTTFTPSRKQSIHDIPSEMQ